MKIKEQWKHALALLGRDAGEPGAKKKRRSERRWRCRRCSPRIPSRRKALPKPTPANLRRFAETPVVRRAINLIKDRVASMDWQVRLKRDSRSGEGRLCGEARARFCAASLEFPNASDSFRTLIEQAIEDALVGGFGAIEMELTGDPAKPFELWPVDGASIRIDPKWDGQPGVGALCAGHGPRRHRLRHPAPG